MELELVPRPGLPVDEAAVVRAVRSPDIVEHVTWAPATVLRAVVYVRAPRAAAAEAAARWAVTDALERTDAGVRVATCAVVLEAFGVRHRHRRPRPL